MDFLNHMKKLALDSKAADWEVLQDITLPDLVKKYSLTDGMTLATVYDRLEELEKAQPAGTDPSFDFKLDEFFFKLFPWICADGNLKADDTMKDFRASLRAQVKALDCPYDPAKFDALMK